MKFTLLMFSLFMSSGAFAGIATGKVTGVIPYYSGDKEMFLIKVENITDTPACNSSLRFAMKSDSPAFKGTYSAVLAALMSGVKVRAVGDNSCNNYSNAESLIYVCLGDTPC